MTTTLAEIRTKAGLSRYEVAKELGITDVAYYYYESGQRKIPSDIALKLAKLLGIKNREFSSVFEPTTFTVVKSEEMVADATS